jgi:ATP-dependent helicase HrpA
MKTVVSLFNEHDRTLTFLKTLILKSRERPGVLAMAQTLERDLALLLPELFPDLYDIERIKLLERYVAAIRIRAERGAIDPVKDAAKAESVAGHTRKLNQLLGSLTGESSGEKSAAVEEFYWMIEEYRVSVFAQELGTPVKISPKRLNTLWQKIQAMI